MAPATRPRRSPGARRARTVAAWVTLALITLGVAAGLGLSAARNQAADPSRTSESVTPSRRLSGSPTRGHTADEVSAYLAELAGLAAEAGRGKQRIGSTMDAYLSGRISSGTAAYEIRKAIHNRQAILAVHKALVAPSDVRAQECGLAFETAMRHSIDADRHFLRIAEGHATREAAVHANDQAGRWKTDFTRQFNALAKAYGVHTRLSPKEI